jgi:hypothetical protein
VNGHTLAATIVFAVLLGAAAFISRASVAPASPQRLACGFAAWPMKTLADPRARLVRLTPKPTTVAAINQLPMPLPTPAVRTRGFERQVWRVRAQIVEYKLEQDQAIHLVLFERGAYLIAEMPASSCLTSKTRDRRAIVRARRLFEARCGAATGSWRQLGAVACVSGVGFWDFPHGQHGHARNYAELHPVTGLRLIAGCA